MNRAVNVWSVSEWAFPGHILVMLSAVPAAQAGLMLDSASLGQFMTMRSMLCSWLWRIYVGQNQANRITESLMSAVVNFDDGV